MKRAFTLIELLVVIAIIAILAAILFPVFAQAKAAAKQTQALSNVKNLTTATLIYASDYDDWRVGRSTAGSPYGGLDWRQNLIPYVKSQDIYRDPVNPAAKFFSFRSDPIYRAFAATSGWDTPAHPAWIDVPESMRIVRGYQWANSYNPGAGGNGFDVGGSMTGFNSPATTAHLVEDKRPNEDDAAWLNWFEDVDSDISWLPGYRVTGLKWNHSGDKYGKKGNVVGYMDGHAKSSRFSQACAGMGPGQMDLFGMNAENVPSNPAWTDGSWGWAQDATRHWNICAGLPAAFK